ncbi:MAG: GNAT family N-acetyltransferase [Solirubrobacteraceae bacterium]
MTSRLNIMRCYMPAQTHRLIALLEDAARGTFPPADGLVEVLPAPPGPAMAVIGFTSHHVMATAAPDVWVREQLPDGDLLAPMSPRFLTALAERLGMRDDGLDVLLAAEGMPGTSALSEASHNAHPRVARASAHRNDIRVFEDADRTALLILGYGLAGRLEVACEVEESQRNQGLATRALIEARHLVTPGQILFAQTAPGNSASLRSLLSAGFHPIGSEVLFF